MEQLKGIDDAILSGITPKAVNPEIFEGIKRNLQHELELDPNEKKQPLSYYELSNKYLMDTNTIYVYFLGVFYRYEEGYYNRIELSDLTASVHRWLRSNPDAWSLGRKSFLNEIVDQLMATCNHESGKAFLWDLKQDKKCPDLVVFKNGVLKVNSLLNDEKFKLENHSKNWFTLTKLDFDYDLNASSPSLFFNYLNRVQPDIETCSFLQEWLGYCLVHDTTLEKFVFFIGEGANGKSVFLTIMRALIGARNVSSLGLGAFRSDDRFSMASTVGKLANIDPDMSDVEKVDAGFLKKYVSGENIPYEEKFKNTQNFKPTARLTFAMNKLPRLLDRSSAIWRRAEIIQWPETIPINERNPKFLREDFWIDSGELPGIFNWAIEGLKRLRLNGKFTQSKMMKEALDEYRLESNPTMQFLLECLVISIGTQVSTRDIYQAYVSRMQGMGHHPLSSTQLTKEIKKQFPQALMTENAMSQGPGISKCRNWINIRIDK